MQHAVEEQGAHLRTYLAQRLTRPLDRHAACRVALVGADVGGDGHHLHPLDGDVELVGDDLRQSGAYPLTDLDLARAHADDTCRIDREPVGEPREGGQAARKLSHARSLARKTAFTIRLWVPQRQRLPSR